MRSGSRTELRVCHYFVWALWIKCVGHISTAPREGGVSHEALDLCALCCKRSDIRQGGEGEVRGR